MSSAIELIARRELLWNLTLRELRGRYKRSLLGWGWSLLNPVAFMIIYTFAFGMVLKSTPPKGDPSGLKSYALFLMCGFLPWNFFSVAVSSSMESVVNNAALVRKVAFPREHLIVSTIIAGLFTVSVEFLVLAIALAFFGNIVLMWVPVVVVVTILVGVFAIGFGLALACGNVFFRDLNYLWSIALQAWFFSTPIIYAPKFVAERLGDYPLVLDIYNQLPMAVIVRIYRDLLYHLRLPAASDFGWLVLYSAISVTFGWWVFNRYEGRFAEEL